MCILNESTASSGDENVMLDLRELNKSSGAKSSWTLLRGRFKKMLQRLEENESH